MKIIDRVSAYPNRYVITDENGNTSYVYLERADEPTVPGTPLNAETFNKRMIESDEYPGCYYRMVDGETEWLNPPMVADVEYRTTERCNGKPVYVKYIDHGKGTTNMYVEIPIGISKTFRYTSCVVKANIPLTEGYICRFIPEEKIAVSEGISNPMFVPTVIISYGEDTSNMYFFATVKYYYE